MSRVNTQGIDYRTDAHTVVPSDTNDLSTPGVGLYIGGTGNVRATLEDGETVTFVGVPVGTILPFIFRRILATGTTATNLVAGR